MTKDLPFPCLQEGAVFDLQLFVDVLQYLLLEQYVVFDNRTYRVVCGSGMGSKHSATVNSVNFLWLAELGFLSEYCHCIQLYARYHDDIIVVTDTPRNAKAAASKLERLASSCYKLEREECSSGSIFRPGEAPDARHSASRRGSFWCWPHY